ncbi:MAG: S4 domain-containing protein, partial [Snowella sp.]
MSERIQKILSQWGVASRRHAEELILQGRVRLNGTVVKLGDKADPSPDRLEVDGKRIEPLDRPKFVYL